MALNVSIWSGVQVAVQSALATAKTITAITKAAPGVVTSTAHGFTAGNYLLLAVNGMVELDARVVRVSATGLTVDVFQMEGDGAASIDTTLFGTFVSGSAQLITFNTNLSNLTSVTGSGGDFAFIDVTTIHDTVDKQIPGNASAATFTFDAIWDTADAGLIALKTASDVKAQRCIRFTFLNGQKLAFVGYVGASIIPTGAAKDKVTTNVVFTAFGKTSVFVN